MTVGPKDVNAIYTGTPEQLVIGLRIQFILRGLAQTEIVILESPEGLVAGDYLTVNGSLLDDLGNSLTILDIPSAAVVHLMIDDVSVPVLKRTQLLANSVLVIHCPRDIRRCTYHHCEFYGGRDWVDPIGVGEPSNPEYYLPSTASVPFNISVPTKISLITAGGDVNREDVMTIEGLLLI